MYKRQKIDKENYRVYTILGDGEIEEGQVWEAAMFAGNHHLDNLTAFVDYNGPVSYTHLQLTWFRRNQNLNWIYPDEYDTRAKMLNKVYEIIERAGILER